MAILQLIDQLHELVNQGIQIPFSAYRMVRAREVEQLLERMRITVPSSIRESERTLAERDRIIADARAEADRILGEARQQAMEMVSERNLLATAQIEAERIIEEGKQIARQRTGEADQYAVQVLQELAQHLQTLEQQVNNGISLLQPGRDASAPGGESRERGAPRPFQPKK
mgnify:CR=1 FL=1